MKLRMLVFIIAAAPLFAVKGQDAKPKQPATQQTRQDGSWDR